MESKSLIERTTRHLKLEMTPEEYKALWDKFAIEQFLTSDGTQIRPYMKIIDDWYLYEENKIALEFWRHIPNYTTARCPICGEVYTERMDTYSLEDWGGIASATSFFVGWHMVDEESASFDPVRCEHFLGVKGFINFNGLEPTELNPSFYSGPPEVPSVIGVFLPDDPVSYAVMHSLPICRVENNEFTPCYSLFMITYFSKNTHIVEERNWSNYRQDMGRITSLIDLSHSTDYDLLRWVADGKLLWLDLEKKDLPLKSGSVDAFPYANIQGSRTRVKYRGINHNKGYLGFF